MLFLPGPVPVMVGYVVIIKSAPGNRFIAVWERLYGSSVERESQVIISYLSFPLFLRCLLRLWSDKWSKTKPYCSVF